jgi:hypothetical protein
MGISMIAALAGSKFAIMKGGICTGITYHSNRLFDLENIMDYLMGG